MLNLDAATLLSRLIVLIIALTLHEFAHAWTADYFGDRTPRQNGRLTLNPLAHLDPMGSLMLIVAGFGWARPVPVNPYALRRKSEAALMWVSLAGPLSNLFLAVLGALPFRLGLFSSYQAYQGLMAQPGRLLPTLPQFLGTFVLINLALMIFNMIPLAPLDGEKVIVYFFPPAWQEAFENIRPYGPMILLILIVGGPILGIDIIGFLLGPPLSFLFSLLVG